jgi:hypothetical protein
MIQLTYLSAAQPWLSRFDLETILEQARRNNAAAGITGLLLHGRGSFLQVLEGPAQALKTCLTRIENDPRHSAMRVVLRSETQARDFGDWSLGFQRVRGDEAPLRSVIDLARAPLSEAIPSELGASIVGFLKSFYDTNIVDA